MPTGGQDRLHLLRALIDGLVPREAGLLAERGHRLDQLIDLGIDQMLPVAGLDIFDLIGRRAGVPVLNCNLIRRAMNRQAQVVRLPRDHEIQRVDRRPKEEPVLIPRSGIGIGNRILAIAAGKIVEIVARAASERVIARAAGQLIGAAAA